MPSEEIPKGRYRQFRNSISFRGTFLIDEIFTHDDRPPNFHFSFFVSLIPIRLRTLEFCQESECIEAAKEALPGAVAAVAVEGKSLFRFGQFLTV